MKLRIPPGCGAVSHGGCSIDIDSEGCVEVEDDAVRALLAHGFTALAEIGAGHDVIGPNPQGLSRLETHELRDDDVGRLNRRGLFALLKAMGISVCLPITNEELRALARNARAPSADERGQF